MEKVEKEYGVMRSETIYRKSVDGQRYYVKMEFRFALTEKFNQISKVSNFEMAPKFKTLKTKIFNKLKNNPSNYVDESDFNLSRTIQYYDIINELKEKGYIVDVEDIKGVAIGVTSMLHATLPLADYILKWACNFINYEDYKHNLSLLAAFGTLCHCEMLNIVKKENIITQKLTDEFLFNRIKQWQEENPEYKGYNLVSKLHDYRKIIISLYVFFKDMENQGYNIIGVEVPMADWDRQIAGCIDLVFEKDGKILITDLKTGTKKQDDTNYKLQLMFYRDIMYKNFSHYKREDIEIANVYMKDYRMNTLVKHLMNPEKTKTKPYDFVLHEITYKDNLNLELVERMYKNNNNINLDNNDIDMSSFSLENFYSTYTSINQ